MKIAQMQDVKFYNKTEKKYYLVYCRKSTESEDRQVQSIEDQIKSAKELASQRGFQILKIFTESKSAKQPGRTVFNEVIETIYKRHDIKGILSWKFNRLSRNPVDEGTLRWLLRSGEIEQIITPDKVYTDADSDFVMAIDGAQGQRFITDLSRDTKRGLKSKTDRGIFPGAAPAGYYNDTTKKQGERDVLPHPIYFSLMKKIFELALTGNFSTEALHKKAMELKIKNIRGNLLSRTAMYEALRNPFYTGKYYRYAGKLYDNGIHKPMISVEQFDLLQDILTKKSHSGTRVNIDLLTGLFKHKCGYWMTGEKHTKKYKNGKSQTFIYYKCSTCKGAYISGKELDSQINAYLKSFPVPNEYKNWAIKWLMDENSEQKKAAEDYLSSLAIAQKTVMVKLNNLLDLKLGQLISEEEFISKKLELAKERDGIQKQLDNLNSNQDEWITFASKTFDFVTTAPARYATGTTEDKKTLLKALGLNLTINEKKLVITLRTPFLLIKEAKPMIDKVFKIEPKNMLLNEAKSSIATENVALGWATGVEPATVRSTT